MLDLVGFLRHILSRISLSLLSDILFVSYIIYLSCCLLPNHCRCIPVSRFFCSPLSVLSSLYLQQRIHHHLSSPSHICPKNHLRCLKGYEPGCAHNQNHRRSPTIYHPIKQCLRRIPSNTQRVHTSASTRTTIRLGATALAVSSVHCAPGRSLQVRKSLP